MVENQLTEQMQITVPEKPEGHVIDFILLSDNAAQPNTNLLTLVQPPESLAHSNPQFYKRVLDQAFETIRKMQPYSTLLANEIPYRMECAHIAYMVEPATTIPLNKPTPYFYYFQLPLTQDVIRNMPFPLTIMSSKGPQTRIKISLKFSLPPTHIQRHRNTPDIFDQFTSISELINNIVRDHLTPSNHTVQPAIVISPGPSSPRTPSSMNSGALARNKRKKKRY